MFPALVILICVLELSFPHLYGTASDAAYYSLWQVQMVLLCAAGVFAENTHRDKSALSVLMLWQAWILISDVYIAASPIPASIEASGFAALVLWALARPYFYPSDEYKPGNVCIAFYKGTNAPLLSSLAALVGLPFSSVAIVTGATALRASGCGKMVLSDAKALLGSDFVLIDTGKQGTPPVIQAITECVGKPTRSFGVFRTRCIANLIPVLKEIGYEPRNWFYFIPSIFYFQCVRIAHG